MRFELSNTRVLAARDYVADGVNSGFRVGIRPHPLVFESARGPHLVDIDGNELIDYVLGMGPMMLGHSPEPVIAAVRAQLDRTPTARRCSGSNLAEPNVTSCEFAGPALDRLAVTTAADPTGAQPGGDLHLVDVGVTGRPGYRFGRRGGET